MNLSYIQTVTSQSMSLVAKGKLLLPRGIVSQAFSSCSMQGLTEGERLLSKEQDLAQAPPQLSFCCRMCNEIFVSARF